MSRYKSELAELDEVWFNIEPDDPNSFDDLPDGKYACRIDRVEVKPSKTSGRLQLVWEFVVEEGDYEGRRIWKYSGLENAENLKFLKNELWRIGLQLQLISQIEEHLTELLDLIVEVQIKTKKKGDQEFRNVYVNKRLDVSGTDDFKPDDVPF